jgi:hypothetical protein
VALGQLGKSDSFSLHTHSQHVAARSNMVPAPPALIRMRSCPNPGEDFDLEDFGDSSNLLGPTNSMPNMPSFNFEEATAPLVDAATKGMDFLRDVGTSMLPGINSDSGAEGMTLMSPMSQALGEIPTTIAKAIAAAKATEIAGRLFLLSQHMPDQGVAPLEVAFQVAFLAVSCNTVYQTAMPKIKAAQVSKFLTPEDQASESLTSGDHKAFHSLFEPAGMDWKQYSEMNLQSMEWVTLEAGQSIKTDDAYWLCQGNMEMEGEGTVPGGLIGEDHIAKTLGMFNGEEISSKVAVAGSEGAKVLKMNTDKLGQMIKKDKSLRAPMGQILFTHLQNKLERATRNLDSEMSPQL